MSDILETYYGDSPHVPDLIAATAYQDLKEYLETNNDKVFYGRQLEVIFEDKYFHWITNRVVRELVANKEILFEKRNLKNGGHIILYWNKYFRYYKREASKVIDIVEKFSKDNVGYAIGNNCELLVLEGFAKNRYLLIGRDSNIFNEKKWQATQHDLDLIIEKDSITYGIEIKNTLGYMDKKEFDLKILLCHFLGIKPVFVARMLPKIWINELIKEGGFALILKYQLFPPLLKELALQMKNELNLPVDYPKSLFDGTIKRFDKWHQKYVN